MKNMRTEIRLHVPRPKFLETPEDFAAHYLGLYRRAARHQWYLEQLRQLGATQFITREVG